MEYSDERDYVQIKADRAEVKRRIDAFISRKRSEVDQLNLQEFCNRSFSLPDSESSCARADAVVVHRNDGKAGHLKVSRVVNQWGPLVGAQPKDPAPSSRGPANVHPTPIEERVSNMESHLNLKPGDPSSRDIYARLKALEDRILYLEGVSPEYFTHSSQSKRRRPGPTAGSNARQAMGAEHSPREIGMRMRALRHELRRQQKRISRD